MNKLIIMIFSVVIQCFGNNSYDHNSWIIILDGFELTINNHITVDTVSCELEVQHEILGVGWGGGTPRKKYRGCSSEIFRHTHKRYRKFLKRTWLDEF